MLGALLDLPAQRPLIIQYGSEMPFAIAISFLQSKRITDVYNLTGDCEQ